MRLKYKYFLGLIATIGLINIIVVHKPKHIRVKVNKLIYIIQDFVDHYIAKLNLVEDNEFLDLSSQSNNSKCFLADHVNTRSKLAEQYLQSDHQLLKKIFDSCKTNLSYEKIIKREQNLIKLDFNLLSKLSDTHLSQIRCNAYRFEKKMDVSEQDKEIEMIDRVYKFSTDQIQVDTHGFYYVICQNAATKYSKIFDKIITVYPSDMSVLMTDRQNFTTSNHSSVHDLPGLSFSQDNEKMNVLIMGIDSVSSNHFRRIFPLTFKYLSTLEHNLIFNHFNSLGRNTLPNVLAMLSGLIDPEINDQLKKDVDKYKQEDYFDNVPFLWYDYEKNGYVTMFQEDDPDIAIFNYLKKGFKQRPTQMYGRPFWLKYYETRSGPDKCHYAYPTYFTWFDMIRNFLQSIKQSRKQKPYFSFNFMTEYTHNYFAVPDNMDEDMRNFLSQLDIDNTLLVIFSDHGNRLKFYSYATEMGQFEKHSPFLSIRVPKKMTRTKYYVNMKQNTNKLISFFDLYQTLRQFLFLNRHGTTRGYDNEFKMNSMEDRARRGTSLFEQVAKDRSCDEAYIPADLCPCLKNIRINETNFSSETGFNFSMLSQMLLEHVNSLTSHIRSKCKEFKFEKLVQIKKFYLKEKSIYRIVYIVEPGNSWFETKLRFRNKKIEFNGQTIRLSAYNDQSKCIDDLKLKEFCFCT